MGDRRGADAALGAHHRDDAADRLGAGPRNRCEIACDEFDHAERPDQIFAHSARHQLAIEHDVVDLAENDDFGAGVAILRELVELIDQHVAVGGRLEDDDVGVGALR